LKVRAVLGPLKPKLILVNGLEVGYDLQPLNFDWSA
jgi:hypothetical protein